MPDNSNYCNTVRSGWLFGWFSWRWWLWWWCCWLPLGLWYLSMKQGSNLSRAVIVMIIITRGLLIPCKTIWQHCKRLLDNYYISSISWLADAKVLIKKDILGFIYELESLSTFNWVDFNNIIAILWINLPFVYISFSLFLSLASSHCSGAVVNWQL